MNALLDRVISEIKINVPGICDVIAMWRHQCGTATVSSSWLLSCFSWTDHGHSQVIALQVWGLVSLTLLAKTNIDIPLDYSMKFKSQWNLNQEWINIFIHSCKCPCLICMLSLLFLSCIGIKQESCKFPSSWTYFSMSLVKKIEWGIYKISSTVIFFFFFYVSGDLSYIRIFMFFHVLRTQICCYCSTLKIWKVYVLALSDDLVRH